MRVKNKDITIGFELECLLDRGYESDYSLIAHTQDITYDGSIYGGDDDYCEREIVTRPLVYQSKNYRAFFDSVADAQAKKLIKFNSSCGLHFHFRMGNRWSMAQELACGDTIRLWQDAVKAEFGRLYTTREKNSYCEPYKSAEKAEFRKSRYKAINILALHEHGTIECRFYGYRRGQRLLDLGEFERFVDLTIAHFAAAYSHDMRKNLFNVVADIDESMQQPEVLQVSI